VPVIAIYNIKGGVGKTTTAVNIAYLAAASDGASTLLWDADPQGAASFYFRIKPRIEGGSKDFMFRRRSMRDAIKGTDYAGLDLLPADLSYRKMDRWFGRFRKPKKRLRKIVGPLRQDYEYIIIDCPPGLSLVSENIFDTADVLVVPTIPTMLSLRTLGQLSRFRDKHALNTVKILAFFSMVDRRRAMHREIVGRRDEFPCPVLAAEIPYASDVESMGIHLAPIVRTHPRSPASAAYRQLWSEIKASLG